MSWTFASEYRRKLSLYSPGHFERFQTAVVAEGVPLHLRDNSFIYQYLM